MTYIYDLVRPCQWSICKCQLVSVSFTIIKLNINQNIFHTHLSLVGSGAFILLYYNIILLLIVLILLSLCIILYIIHNIVDIVIVNLVYLSIVFPEDSSRDLRTEDCAGEIENRSDVNVETAVISRVVQEDLGVGL